MIDAIRQAISSLDSEDVTISAKAAAGVFALSNRPETAPYLSSAIPRLIPLLVSPNTYCQRNACAALTSILSVNGPLFAAVINADGLIPTLVPLLTHEDSGMRLNASSAVGALSQQVEGIEALNSFQGFEPLIRNLSTEPDVRVVESGVDALCTASSHESQREALLELGAVEALAECLKQNSNEVRVRALLGLGMLLGSNSRGQVKFAAHGGAIQSLLRLMRSEDKDVKGISSDCFAVLATNPSLKSIIAAEIRQGTARQ